MWENIEDKMGRIANLQGVMAEAPGLLEGYMQLHQLALNSSLTDEEVTVVWQPFNVEHNCHYCVPAHTAIAHMMKVDPAITEALRNGTSLPTEKLEVLRDTALAMSRSRGNLSDEEKERFYTAGYENRQLLEIVLVLPRIKAAGASLVAITPELPDESLTTSERHELAFEVLTDRNSDYARGLGIVFTVSEKVRPIYENFGIDLEKHNGEGQYDVPLAATFVVDADGTVVYAAVDADYTVRAEPEDVVAVLEGLKS